MPYAANNQISRSPLKGGIEITDEEYRQALDGMASGLQVQVANGAMSLVEPPTKRTTYWLYPAEKHETQPGEEPPDEAVTVAPPDEYHVIDGGQWVYSLERERESMSLTMYQAESALLDAGMLDDVEALMDSTDTPRRVKIMWKRKGGIRRMHPATLQMASALGWTDEQLDDLFRAGRDIEP